MSLLGTTRPAVLLLLLVLSATVWSYHSSCDKSSCYPATGNLLIGRENHLSASSTCGLKQRERYCIVNNLEERKKCFWCDSRQPSQPNTKFPLSHRIENIVHTGGTSNQWWQSQNGVENVTIQLNLEAEFHFTHLIITFKTFRPAIMLVERSYDFGNTWQVYRYFAYDCDSVFPSVPKESPRNLTEVVCDQRYSTVIPSTNGEVILRVLPPNLHHMYDDPYSSEVQNLLKMTNLRINFTKLHTLGDDLLDSRDEILEKYYYAISEMVVRGSCSCYGHASRCLPQDGTISKPDMVHGQCECTHNTKGLNCEACEDFFNDFPWKPAIGRQTNACRRCNCNNHATSCHHDPAVFEMTGRTSGGVCDGCTDNTMGRNCEQCKQYFYQDPTKPFTDRDVCLPCDCDPSGSLDDGICDSKTDPVNGLESGRCHCKTNVEGRRCDVCKNGFWAFSEQNPDGCQACTCNTQGTIDNQGCDKVTGECTCKRNVIGRDCNQCMPGHWGLSEGQDGCKPCDCDIGGAYDNMCDVITGQCKCRPHLTGRTCSSPEQNFFVGPVDILVSEAELANCTDNCQVHIREPFRDGRDNTWTGTGFMKIYDDAELIFDVKNVPLTTNYEIVLRYEPQVPYDWDNVRVTVERPEPLEPNGTCAIYEQNYNAGDIRDVVLSPASQVVIASPPVCLEATKDYKIRINFQRTNNKTQNPSASILVDSLVLIPHVEAIPFFEGTPANEQRLAEYKHYRCKEAYYTVLRGRIPDVCQKFHYSVGFYYLNGAFSCQCDPTGSLSTICDSLGGQCPCKPNVVGRKCDRCAPGTYGFNPEGCKACDCNSVGALDNLCDVVTGQCKCRAQTYGRECDQCEPGSWNYPNCQRCMCHGHTDVCDSHTGTCLNCQGFTEGTNCDRCIKGYYGDPRLGVDIPCRPCPCPGTAESGHSYAQQCALDPKTQDVYCECQEGYKGARCDVCDENYYGNPEVPGGSCKQCSCNNNVDITRPGNCDPHTGKCLQCLFDTEGENCDVCKTGFYGDAIHQTCRECVCDFLGSQSSVCNHTTGQCPCLNNVIGLSCDQCKPDHWKIASGTGCEPCNCDPVGSLSEKCNQFDGQCQCKPGFGGTQCNQCQTNYWGDPNKECYPCECNPEGSATQQCNQTTGFCNCVLGIGGEKCDICARGYLGTAPNCSPCGECFENWDQTQKTLIEQTDNVIKSASEIKATGASGAYTVEFENMEKKITDVKNILHSTTKSSIDLQTLNEVIDQLRVNQTTMDQLNAVTKTLDNTTQKVLLANLTLENLKAKTMALKETALNLKQNSTKLQERNVEGALNLTKDAFDRARMLKNKENLQDGLLADAERQCKRTEAFFGRNVNTFNQGIKDNERTLERLSQEMNDLNKSIPTLNHQICARETEGCDTVCGGAGCGFCGGIDCEEGAMTKADSAYSYAKKAEKHIKEKEAKAEELYRGLSQANQEINSVLANSKSVGDLANTTKIQSQNILNESYSLIDRHDKFLHPTDGVQATDVATKVDEILRINIQLKPEQLSQLSDDINKTLSTPKNIDKIIADTKGDLHLAKALNEDAESKQMDAKNILQVAERVEKALAETQEIQKNVEDGIVVTNKNIMDATESLNNIKSDSANAQVNVQKAMDDIVSIEGKLKTLQTGFLKNSLDATNVRSEAKNLTIEVDETEKKADQLLADYKNANNTLENRVKNSKTTRNNSQYLLERASQLSANTTLKLKELGDAEKMFEEQEKLILILINNTTDLNARMSENLNEINSRSDYYRTCNN
ncbi:laminin subunit beta-1-like [Adelges cooleyi]|uniref:laminin subunit beta-1-like n=1 Tax=Adelges cooleyi TaxID=133065 RepID=UPI00217F34AC|nr:laminin subunit beta-1-like [Adelges cooleyi]